MNNSSIQLINKEALLEQREKLLQAIAETEGMLKALGWTPPAKAIRSRTRLRPEKKSLRDMVLEACVVIHDNITRERVVDYIESEYPDLALKESSIGATISNLKNDNEIEEIERGVGGRPSIFRIPKPD